jgi:3-dehydroquinate dehydratase-2
MDGEVLLLSGPNLDQLGSRDPAIYGRETLDQLVARFTASASARGLGTRHYHSGFEGALVEEIHRHRLSALAVVINPGALGHYSWSLRDALEVFPGVRIEVHLSNPQAREPFRHRSTLAGVVDGTIAGFGPLGYSLAAGAVADLLARRRTE